MQAGIHRRQTMIPAALPWFVVLDTRTYIHEHTCGALFLFSIFYTKYLSEMALILRTQIV